MEWKQRDDSGLVGVLVSYTLEFMDECFWRSVGALVGESVAKWMCGCVGSGPPTTCPVGVAHPFPLPIHNSAPCLMYPLYDPHILPPPTLCTTRSSSHPFPSYHHPLTTLPIFLFPGSPPPPQSIISPPQSISIPPLPTSLSIHHLTPS